MTEARRLFKAVDFSGGKPDLKPRSIATMNDVGRNPSRYLSAVRPSWSRETSSSNLGQMSGVYLNVTRLLHQLRHASSTGGWMYTGIGSMPTL
jgi:hypothetical protein